MLTVTLDGIDGTPPEAPPDFLFSDLTKMCAVPNDWTTLEGIKDSWMLAILQTCMAVSVNLADRLQVYGESDVLQEAIREIAVRHGASGHD